MQKIVYAMLYVKDKYIPITSASTELSYFHIVGMATFCRPDSVIKYKLSVKHPLTHQETSECK